MTAAQERAEFCFLHADSGPEGLFRRFEAFEFVRSEKWFTFKAALNLLHQRGGKTIVETGTMRMHLDPAGGSTKIFGEYCKRFGARLTTVDISPQNMETSRRETVEYAGLIDYVVEDSVAFLKRFDRPVDLLYLDSQDCSPTGDSTPAQEHQVKEYLAAKHALGLETVILLDDNGFPAPSYGKTRLLKRVLPDDGWECVADRSQSLWQMKRMF